MSKLTGAKLKPALIVLALGLALWFMPVPTGLTSQVWHLFVIFLSLIVAIILKPLPMGALAIISLAMVTITNTLTIKQALSGYSSHIIWLVFIAFLLARGFIKTGLGARIAYCFVLVMGRSTLGLAYGLVSAELLFAPFIPSNTARGAGIIYPIVSALASEYDSAPSAGTERKIGSYLIVLCYQANIIVSAMFLTAMAGNPLIASLAMKLGVEMTWLFWAKAMIVPGLVNIAVLPLIVYWLYPPELKSTPEAPALAKKKLQGMGSLSHSEFIMLLTFGLLLILWVFGKPYGISSTTAALVGLSILLITGVLTWEDILKEHNALNTFIWLATILTLSSFLTEFGMIEWFGMHVKTMVVSYEWPIALGMVALVYFYSHYLFGSLTAHISSMYSVLVVVAIAAGAPVAATVILFAAFSSLCAGLTHYATGTAPVYFGTNFVSVKDWWRVGGIVSLINIAIWIVVGFWWWGVIGLW
ncbi:MAG: anion permease [Legionellales bacterium]|nr:MAG: anion permease [Legionellales bacterium]